MTPSADSPLLLPMNSHRQLVVIDFEYASANPRGYEIGNHFCEWMANYHSPIASHELHEACYPTIEEQRNFLRAYIGHSIPHHHKGFPCQSSQLDISVTPELGYFNDMRLPPPPDQYMLDARTPIGAGGSARSYREEEAVGQEALEQEVECLRQEARVWRPASHATWAAWGVLQAKIPSEERKEDGIVDEKWTDGAVNGQDGDKFKEFDHLGYAQERVLFFWGDMIALGIMSEEEVHNVFSGSKEWWERVKRMKQFIQ